MRKRIRAAYEWSVETYVLYVVVGLVVGGALAPAAMGATGGPDGTVAVVLIEGSIGGQEVVRYQQQMQQARQEADAVVVMANSGGGSAAASEEMYLQTKRVAEDMPVVASVDAAAASGGYFAIVPADEIYVKPSSLVGSVGVIATVPPQAEPNDLVATSGPEKFTGGDGRPFYYKLRTVQQGFLNAVFEQRGDRLRLSRSQVAHASTYAGTNAVEHGLVDEIGDRQSAVARAAELAGLDRPRVVVIGTEGVEHTYLLRSTYLASSAENKRMIDSEPYYTPTTGVPTFLMVPAAAVDARATVVSAGTDLPADSAADTDGVATDDGAGASVTSNASDAGPTERWTPGASGSEVGADA